MSDTLKAIYEGKQIGPVGAMLEEIAAGNPGALHMLEELAEAKRRLREYEGMMTRREVLSRWEYVDRKSWDNPSLTAYATEARALRVVLGAQGVHGSELAHELALMMAQEREGEA